MQDFGGLRRHAQCVDPKIQTGLVRMQHILNSTDGCRSGVLGVGLAAEGIHTKLQYTAVLYY